MEQEVGQMRNRYWSQSLRTRCGFLRACGSGAATLALAPVLVACRGGSAKQRGDKAVAAGDSALKPVKGGTLTSSLDGDISNLDYAFVADSYSNVVISNCVESLLKVDTQGQPIGLLATTRENPDDRTYIFKLRRGVKFQDGTDFNADAVEYSLNRIRANKASTVNQQLIYVDLIEKPDPGTIKLTLSSPFAPLLGSLAANSGRVISPATVERYGRDRLKTDLTNVGTGPFKFVEWKTDDHVTLVRNEQYWGRDAAGTQLPYVDKLVYRVIPDRNVVLAALRNGDLDVLSLGLGYGPPPKDTASVRADPALSYQQGPGNSIQYLHLNEGKEPFSSRELRQALCYAIDRMAITHTLMFDTASPFDVIFGPSLWTYDPDFHPYLKRDVAKAKQLLAQAGKPNGFGFTLAISTIPGVLQIAGLIKDQLKEAGIEMAIQVLEFPKLQASVRTSDYQAAHFNFSAGSDPDGWVYSSFSTKGSQNPFIHYSNPEVDRLLEQARTTLETAARKPLYQQAQRLIVGDAAFCVYAAPTVAAVSSKKVHNIPLGPTPAVGASQVWKTA